MKCPVHFFPEKGGLHIFEFLFMIKIRPVVNLFPAGRVVNISFQIFLVFYLKIIGFGFLKAFKQNLKAASGHKTQSAECQQLYIIIN